MYESTHQLTHRPFAATPDPACFFTCETNIEIFNALVDCLDRGQGIGILTGAAGVGKTLLCRRVLQETSNRFKTVFIGNANFTNRRAFLQALVYELGDDYSNKDDQELRLDLRRHLQAIRLDQQSLALVIDEAHLFSDEILEEVRVISDLDEDGSPLVRVILSGQLSLEERLTERAFDALNQRVSEHSTLEPLTQSEAVQYIVHRLQWAGADPSSLITDQAIRNIARASGGVPRCIHQLADHSLMLAHSRGEQPVQATTVVEALQHLKRLPLQWNDLNDLSSFSSAAHIDDIELHLETADDLVRQLDAEEFEADESEPHASFVREPSPTPIHQTAGDTHTETATFEFGGDSAEEPLQATDHTERSVEAHGSQNLIDSNASDPNEGLCITLASPRRRNLPRIDEAFESASSVMTPTSNQLPIQESSVTEWNFDRDDSDVETLTSSDSSVAPNTSFEDPITEDFAVVHFEEEVVIDHYAALQEPEFSGIIWNLARKTAVNSEPGLMIEPVHDECCDSPIEPTAEVEHVSHSIEFDAVESAPMNAHAPHFDIDSTDEDFSDNTEGYVEDIRQSQPQRYLDTIMPMIDDVMEQDGAEEHVEARGKNIEDVEAEMFDAISLEDPQIEDSIGSDVLDLVFETQAALRSSQQALAKSLEKQLEYLDDEEGEEQQTYPINQFDVVQPDEESPRASAPQIRESQSQPHVPELDHHERIVGKRPYSRLFTDLRRRHPRAG